MEEHTSHVKCTCSGLQWLSNYKCRVIQPVKFTMMLLLILGTLLLLAFFIADLGLGRIQVSDAIRNSHASAIIVAGIFTFFACCLTAHQIYQHFRHWTHAPSQRYIVRILLMVPVYAVCEFMSLTFLDLSEYLVFIITCFEAYTIYNFMMLLSKYSRGHENTVIAMRKTVWQQQCQRKGLSLDRPQPQNLTVSRPFPLCCFPAQLVDSDLLWQIKHNTLQYTIVVPVCAIFAMVGSKSGFYEEGDWNIANLYPIVTALINLSQMWALYNLVRLYMLLKIALAPFKPHAKFLCVKAVCFFCFWQGMVLNALAYFSIIHEGTQFSVSQQVSGWQSLIICIEMFIFSCSHYWVFSCEPYKNPLDSQSVPFMLSQQLLSPLATMESLSKVDSQDKNPFETHLGSEEPPLKNSDNNPFESNDLLDVQL